MFERWGAGILAVVIVIYVLSSGMLNGAVSVVGTVANSLMLQIVAVAVAVGAVVILAGLALKMVPHPKWHAHGHHMFKNGVIFLIAAAVIGAGAATAITRLAANVTTPLVQRIDTSQPGTLVVAPPVSPTPGSGR